MPERHLVRRPPGEPPSEGHLESRPDLRLEVGDEVLLIELAHERDIFVRGERVDEIAGLRSGLRVASPTHLGDRSGRVADVVAWRVPAPGLLADLLEGVVEVVVREPRLALAGEPRDPREDAAGDEDAANLAQDAEPVRDELEDEGRHRRVERGVLEREVVRRRDAERQAAALRR